MMALILIISATFFEEVSSVFTKKGISDRKESVYTAAFLNLFFVTLWFLAIVLYRNNFVFSLQSLPTFALRMVFEFALLTIALKAIAIADRTTFSFIHSGTVPLLLVIDIFLGYSLYPKQILGIVLFCAIVTFLAFSKGIKRDGSWHVIVITIGAAATLSFYKYDITHYNSPEAEQFMANLILLVYIFFYNLLIHKENSFRYLRNVKFFTQSFTIGIASVLISFAYVYGAASVITALKRVGEIFWAFLSGGLYFKEKNLITKLVLMFAFGFSIVLLLP